MSKVFISRNLNKKSKFIKQLELEGLEVIGRSLIQFSLIPFEKIPHSDWVFFYSKNGVKYFLEGINKEALLKFKSLIKIQTTKLATIGSGTAMELANAGFPPHFIGHGDPSKTASDFLKLTKGKRVLFVRAKNSRKSIQNLLEAQIEVLDLVVYQNQSKSHFSLPECEYLVFTSPLNVKAYFNKYSFFRLEISKSACFSDAPNSRL